MSCNNYKHDDLIFPFHSSSYFFCLFENVICYSINVTVPRIGGGFGGKAMDSCAAAAAVTLGAYVTRRYVVYRV